MGEKIALDSMIFIYLFEADSRYIQIVESLFEQVEQGEKQAITSTISVIETLSPWKYEHDSEKRIEITRFFEEMHGLVVYPVSWEISLEAAVLRRAYPSLRTPDAIQLATALIYQASYFICLYTHLTLPTTERV